MRRRHSLRQQSRRRGIMSKRKTKSKKGKYRTIGIQQVNVEQEAERLGGVGSSCILAIDVAKKDFVAGLAHSDGAMARLFRWEHPMQTPALLDLVVDLRNRGLSVEAAMEPTGTYGDSVRYQLATAEIPVFQISPKRAHDAAEVYDGVPSHHDAKSCTILAKLHADGISRPWPMESEQKLAARAAIELRDLRATPLERNYGQLEAKMAKYWPELPSILRIQTASMQTLLERFGSPAQVASNAAEAIGLLKTVSRGSLNNGVIEAIVESASTTLGVPMGEAERQFLMTLAGEMNRLRRLVQEADKHIADLVETSPGAQNMASQVGKTTAVVVTSYLGEPGDYGSAAAYEKASGLNLKERSSGKHKGKLKITKRGPSKVRRYLFLAALRLIRLDPVTKAWYAKRAGKKGEGAKAVIAVTRKLVRALWYVGQGAKFDSTKLFDVSRLDLDATEPPIA